MRQLEKLKEEIEREQRKYSEQRFAGSGKENWATHKEDDDKMEDGVSAASHNSESIMWTPGRKLITSHFHSSEKS